MFLEILNYLSGLTADKLIFTPLLFTLLYIGRKDNNLNFLLILYIMIEFANLAIHDVSMTWGAFYFLRCMAFDLIFLSILFYRRQIALALYRSKNRFIRKQGRKWVLSFRHYRLNASILGIIIVGMMISGVSFVEASFFSLGLKENISFIETFFNKSQWAVQGLTMLYFLAILFKSRRDQQLLKKRKPQYERTRTEYA